MINAILLNPTIDLIYDINNFHIGGTFIVDNQLIFPVGKAISFALAARKLHYKEKINVFAMIGKEEISQYSRFLDSNRLDYKFIPVDGKTRSNKTINDPLNSTTTHIRELGFSLKREDINKLKDFMKENLRKGDICVFSGSIPPNLDKKIYKDLINIANQYQTITCLDSSGQALNFGIKANPNIIKPNLVELSQILNDPNIRNLDFTNPFKKCKRIINKAIDLLNEDLRIILITMGKEGAILLNNDIALYGNVNVERNIIDIIGSGDAFLAGFITLYSKERELLTCFKNAIAAGAANTLQKGPGFLKYDDYNNLLKKVEISKIF